MNFDFLFKPTPLYGPIILLGIFIWRCCSIKHLPGAEKLIELLVIGFTFYQSSLLIIRGWASCGVNNDSAFGLFLSGCAIAYVSYKQVNYLFERMEPDPVREKLPKSSAGGLKRKRKGGN